MAELDLQYTSTSTSTFNLLMMDGGRIKELDLQYPGISTSTFNSGKTRVVRILIVEVVDLDPTI